VLGGDLNTHDPSAPELVSAAGNGVDHVLVRVARPAAAGRTLDHGRLSDHAPVLAEVA
jgi:endonuclease/exonuclease/phosphatase (EEP) superfamily protein YafD